MDPISFAVNGIRITINRTNGIALKIFTNEDVIQFSQRTHLLSQRFPFEVRKSSKPKIRPKIKTNNRDTPVIYNVSTVWSHAFSSTTLGNKASNICYHLDPDTLLIKILNCFFDGFFIPVKVEQ